MSNHRDGADALTILGAAALGAAIGAAAALLLAPKPGTELREELKASAQSAVDKMHKVAEQVTDQVKSATADLAEQACCEHAPESEADAETN